ncbi:hypothetical protein GUJ93_ZPchr0006g43507 [Zizania palustris]|uniref:Uncharacterized protein n=1 Tax=Zizania palustris TaxID=103762 RepID=A0A8J5TAF2_ZIZPA|nr:hypothetical protein GUJ93_ZPchr0006g43507 [Zizania palustris]
MRDPRNSDQGVDLERYPVATGQCCSARPLARSWVCDCDEPTTHASTGYVRSEVSRCVLQWTDSRYSEKLYATAPSPLPRPHHVALRAINVRASYERGDL